MSTFQDDEYLSHPFLLLLMIMISSISLLLLKKYVFNHHPSTNQPPSPPRLPILGNLHQLSLLAHRSLHSLGTKHGPIMLLHFGSKPVIVVQSAELATQIVRDHDLIFSDKPYTSTTRRLLYDLKDIIISPYGEYWRKLKSICVLQLLSTKRVQSFRYIREEETEFFLNKIGSSSSSACLVNLSELFDLYANNVVCRAAFGRRYGEEESGKRFLMLLRELFQVMGAAQIGEFVPWLSWISRVNGFKNRVDKVSREIDHFLEMVVQKHLDGGGLESIDEKRENFVDILLNADIDRDSIKAIILDMLAGGTDTTSATLEWAMTELLRNPKIMRTLQTEVRGILNGRHDITDDDLGKMQYLKAVIKETLRLHPTVPLLGRVARQDVTVMGYEIAATTLVITNVWAIGRDPMSWDQPQEFRPGRFLNSSLDFKGLDFKFIPFGYGRRGCPGITLAVTTVEILLANLVHKFEWKLPKSEEDLDVMEQDGVTLHRKHPLLALPTTYHL